MPITAAVISEFNSKEEKFIAKATANGGGKALLDMIQKDILPKIPNIDHKKMIKHADMEVHYESKGKNRFFVITKGEGMFECDFFYFLVPQRVCWAFIDDVKNRYAKEPKNAKAILKENIVTQCAIRNNNV